MADTKVSALASTASLNSGDYLLLVQGGSSVKIDVQTLFKNIPVRPVILEATEAPLSGAISTLCLATLLTTAVTHVAYTLAAGTHGMSKEIVVGTFVSSGTAVITVTGASRFATITFNNANSAVILKNYNGNWFILSANNVVFG